MKKPFVRLALIWLCVLALLCVFDVTVLKNIRVEVSEGVEIAPYRLLAIPISLAKSIPERGSYDDLVQQLGLASGCVGSYGKSRGFGYYDLQWGGSALFAYRADDNTYFGFTVSHTRLGTGRWLILPGIMLAVAIAEVVVYKHRKKKKGKAINKPESPEPQPEDTPQQT